MLKKLKNLDQNTKTIVTTIALVAAINVPVLIINLKRNNTSN